MKLRDLLFIFIVLFVIPQAAISHHSASILFNMEKMVSIEGIVTEVWFQNPHSRYYVEKSTEKPARSGFIYVYSKTRFRH